MDNNPSEEIEENSENNEGIWSNGKSISQLESSEGSMGDERKEIIRRALEFDIIDIRTYGGYKGDLLVEITTMDPSVAKSIENIAKILGIETVTQQDVLSVFRIFCITPSSEGYDLK